MKNRRKFLKGSLALTALTLGSSLALASSKNKSSQAQESQKPFEIPIANPSEEAKANALKNHFGLVYENAIVKNEPGKVHITSVSYTSRKLKIAANLYTPSNFNANEKYPAIVVAHPNGGVKEQVAGLYAQNLAGLGYITLAFDAAYQGASEGFPRNTDTPNNRSEDILAAVDFLSTYKGVDSSKLGVLGICGGGGYTIEVAKKDKRLKAVATLSMFNTGLVRREGFLGSQKDSIQARLSQAIEAREEALKGKILYTSTAPKKLSEAELAKISTDLYREGSVYYGDTHAHPNSTFAFTTSSLTYLMSWDAVDEIELINAPLLMLVGDKADTAYMSEAAFKKAKGTKQKKLYRLKNATHIQTYHEPRIVAEAMGQLQEFFAKNL